MKKKIIGFTNGCFDIFHYGHAYFLKKAKYKCDTLIVGLNSDLSVKKLKGHKRPINNYNDRKRVLLSTKYVDKVIKFSENTPILLIKKLKPDIIFKGGDYKKKNIVGYGFQKKRGKKAIVIGYLKGRSTSEILKKL